MVAKSKIAHKQTFKKVAKNAAKISAKAKHAKKPKKPKTKAKAKQAAPVVQNEPESDHGEEMLDMMEDEDLKFLKSAVNTKQYSMFNNLHLPQSKGKKRKAQGKANDETLENKYENEIDDNPRVKVKALLPIKTKQGIVARTIEHESDDNEEAEDCQETDENESGDKACSDEDSFHCTRNESLDISRPVTPAQLLLQRAEILAQKKLHVGTLSSGLLENPTEKVANFRTLLRLLDDDTPEVYVTIRKLVIVALLEVFKDVLPAYQIKAQDVGDVRLKKETLNLHKHEAALLHYYKKYLQRLEKFARTLCGKRARTRAERNVGEVAVHAMCDLLVAHPYFNYAPNVVQAVVPFLNNGDKNVRALVATAMKAVFKEDKKEEITLKIVRVINAYLRKHAHDVHPEMVEILLSLRIKDVNLDRDKAVETKAKKLEAHRANVLARLSKRERKRKKRLRALEQELLETKAEENKQTTLKNRTEITKHLFGIYFRILKGASSARVLGACLAGLALYAHCVNLEYSVDIVDVLEKLVGAEWPGARGRLQCIRTAFALLGGGQGAALTLDPTRFYVRLYAGMLDVHVGRTEWVFDVLLDAIVVAVVQRRKRITTRRVVGFAKRLATLSLQTSHGAALGCLGVVKQALQACRAADVLLDVDAECGDGRYDAELDDPEYCNAAGTALYELALLGRHYHPVVATYAAHIAKGVPAAGEGSLPPIYGKRTPQELYSMFDMSEMAFNPSIPAPKKVQASGKMKKHSFVDGDFRRQCYTTIRLSSDIVMAPRKERRKRKSSKID